MPNQIVIQFAAGGFILTKLVDGVTETQVFTSPGKLNKAIRESVAELSLLPKKAEDDAE